MGGYSKGALISCEQIAISIFTLVVTVVVLTYWGFGASPGALAVKNGVL